MTDYILDVAKWRCGGNGPNRLGTGHTEMLNEEGFSCCLGQFAKQFGVTDDCLLNKLSPDDVASDTGHIYDPGFVDDGRGSMENTLIASLLMRINDNDCTAPREKIARIRKELEADGHTLTVLNEDMLPP